MRYSANCSWKLHIFPNSYYQVGVAEPFHGGSNIMVQKLLLEVLTRLLEIGRCFIQYLDGICPDRGSSVLDKAIKVNYGR